VKTTIKYINNKLIVTVFDPRSIVLMDVESADIKEIIKTNE